MIITNPLSVLNVLKLSFRSILSQSKPFTTKARSVLEKKKDDLIPKAKIKWYYATDVPISKPSWYNYTKVEEAKTFLPFSDYDSQRIEKQFKKYFERGDESITSKIEVSEDKLFEVDVKNFELSPIYWEGPVYEVRRGLWFTSDGVPLSHVLTQQIEMGFEAKKPYLFDEERKMRAENPGKFNKADIAKFNSDEDIGEVILDIDTEEIDDIVTLPNNKAVLYFNNNRAALFPDSMINDYQLPIIRRFGATAVSLLNVTHIQRGFTSDLTASIFDNIPENPIPGLTDILQTEVTNLFTGEAEEPIKKSTNYSDENDGNESKQNKEMKRVIEDDFENDTTEDTSTRELDHVVFCVHGIGQVLGTKYESINFAHNINVMRNTMKAVYKDNPLYKKLAYGDKETSDSKFNNRIQVLPIAWRHMIDFHPNKLPKEIEEDSRLPTLSQINVDGVRSLRNVIGDVALDILLYYESKYFNQILASVTNQLNFVYEEFMKRNPDFKGKFHVLGHSLGSAIVFDIASLQYNTRPKNPDKTKDLLFDIDSLFCIGCPVGVFKLISQKNIVNRKELPEDYDPRLPDLSSSSPKCVNLYNLFHPCDPVGYRIEPLIKPRFSNFLPEEVPFAVEGIDTQIKGLASFTDDLQEKIASATSWILKSNRKSKLADGIQDKFIDENALGEIVSSIVKSDEEEADTTSKGKLSTPDLKILTSFNKNARVDYCLPMKFFDISLVSAISAHVSYFEDQNTSGFIMSKLLSSTEPVTSKTVLIKDTD